jgi:ABC-type antimicrobial peptide transport system permease subunit
MFVYADFASAIPFSNTIEGIVYLKKEFVKKRVFWTIQLEAILYSIMFGLLSAWLLILISGTLFKPTVWNEELSLKMPELPAV